MHAKPFCINLGLLRSSCKSDLILLRQLLQHQHFGEVFKRKSSILSQTTVCPDVHRHSHVRIKTFDCSPKIGPLDYYGQPAQSINLDCMIIKHCDNCSVRIESRRAAQAKINVDHDVEPDAEACSLVEISTTNASRSVRCTIHNEPHAELCGCQIQLPAYTSLDLQSDGDADIIIANLDLTRCSITCAGGMTTLRKLKCSDELKLYCKCPVTIQDACEAGNVSIRTVSNRGFVRAHGRLIAGKNVTIDTTSGFVQCDSIYAGTSIINTTDAGGNVDIKDLHGNAKIFVQNARVHVSSHTGDNLIVHSKAGDIDVDLLQSRLAQLETQNGSINVGVAENDNKSDSVYLNLKSDAGITLDRSWSVPAFDEQNTSFSSGVLEWQGMLPCSSGRTGGEERVGGKINPQAANNVGKQEKKYAFDMASVQLNAVAKHGGINVKKASWFGNLFSRFGKLE